MKSVNAAHFFRQISALGRRLRTKTWKRSVVRERWVLTEDEVRLA